MPLTNWKQMSCLDWSAKKPEKYIWKYLSICQNQIVADLSMQVLARRTNVWIFEFFRKCLDFLIFQKMSVFFNFSENDCFFEFSENVWIFEFLGQFFSPALWQLTSSLWFWHETPDTQIDCCDRFSSVVLLAIPKIYVNVLDMKRNILQWLHKKNLIEKIRDRELYVVCLEQQINVGWQKWKLQ